MNPPSACLPLACLLLTSLILSGCCDILTPKPPNGLNLTVSERLDPSVSVFVLGSNQTRITSIENYSMFFPQQSGLPEGTEYGFRVTYGGGWVAMPVYEAFKAKTPEQIGQDGMETGNRYYRDLRGGKYVIELLTINGDKGTVVAKMDFSSITPESRREERIDAIRIACANVTSISGAASEEENRSYRNNLTDCATSAAVSLRDPDTCGMEYAVFNVSVQDGCLDAYANSTGDISACDKASVPWVRGLCKAKATNDWTECTRIICDWTCQATMTDLNVHKDLCIFNFAWENRNASPSLCGELKNSEYRDTCVKILTKPQGSGNGS